MNCCCAASTSSNENVRRILVCLSGKRKSGKDFFAARLAHSLTDIVRRGLTTNVEPILSVSVVGISFSLKKRYAHMTGLDAQKLKSDGPYKETVRRQMVEYGEQIRAKNPDFFCREAIRMVVADDDDKLKGDGSSAVHVIIVSDCRRLTDFAYFRRISAHNVNPECPATKAVESTADSFVAFGAPIFVRIDASLATRRARGFKFVAGIDDAPTECALDAYDAWDLCVHNDDGDERSLQDAIDRIGELCLERIRNNFR